ncbi:5' nucleotidase, NT5C type [Polluticoccus soli]|uniref:5' nucleotidase, NT5C type n=1 Tax=Polluticoccus soli TaxID=3034150 RepID=UPI0023E19B6C|nr:5'(3')-deoxyribonucleotidase [Flavipsychrobacter sp. JY13-12]
MKRLAVDMDGVLADVYSQFIKKHHEETGEWLSLNSMTGLSEGQVFPHGRKHITTKGFFDDIQVVANSQEILEELNKHYKVFVVSAAMEFPLSLSEKQQWLDRHFPFIGWRQRVFCGSKEIIKADIMIDDYLRNLDSFEGETYLFTEPHNALVDLGRHKRVNDWLEIKGLLLP